ncbi:Protein of unknown function [Pyronema omphalodes CBS 100304]|uniref:Uncharacterized protein n=1 Tax=Pyronema omphalodes (strain CBS 100304) TaxID=1076935 RepID=U4LR88_PYROM|nr:Protein of unknown function [Pyronema omphalodes CBS 100304]
MSQRLKEKRRSNTGTKPRELHKQGSKDVPPSSTAPAMQHRTFVING